MSDKIWSSAKSFDLEYLKTKIIPIKKKLFKNHEKNKLSLGFVNFPFTYYKDLVYIANLYNSNVAFIKDSKSHGFKRDIRLIYFAYKDNDLISTWDICTTFSHELAHAIQQQVNLEDDESNHITWELLSHAHKYERIAERLAYFIHKEYFTIFHDIKPQVFKTYLSNRDKLFLANNYPKLKNDLIKEK